jgi:hypothetical protein
MTASSDLHVVASGSSRESALRWSAAYPRYARLGEVSSAKGATTQAVRLPESSKGCAHRSIPILQSPVNHVSSAPEDHSGTVHGANKRVKLPAGAGSTGEETLRRAWRPPHLTRSVGGLYNGERRFG